jgi:protocatechuate 3,4-dioxygenase alpha subunit
MLPTSQQTIGPFVPRGFIAEVDNDLTRVTAAAAPTRRGETILLRGAVTQLGGKPCVNAILECWQADAGGRFAATDAEADPDFIGWGRTFTDAAGAYEFRTVLPGGFQDATGRRAPHANLTVMGAGLMRRVLTTVFFAPDAADPVLAALPAGLRPLLLARAAGEEDGLRVFRFDIRLRGEGETPFFDL